MVSKWQGDCFVHLQGSQPSDMTKIFLVNFPTTYRGKWSQYCLEAKIQFHLWSSSSTNSSPSSSLSFCSLNWTMKGVDGTIVKALLAGTFSESGRLEVLLVFHEVPYKEILQEISNQFDIDKHGYVDQPSIKLLLYKMEGVKYLQGKSTISHQQLHQVAGDNFFSYGDRIRS